MDLLAIFCAIGIAAGRNWTIRLNVLRGLPGHARTGAAHGLGAGAPHLLRIVISHGLGLTLAGVGIGAAVAFGLTRLLGNLLYKVSPRDPESFGAAFLVMVAAAASACFLPAWRATRTDPVRALRE